MDEHETYHGFLWLTTTYPKKNIHGLRCFKMRWFNLDTKHEKTYAHLYTTSSFKEQWLDRNVSAALRNDAPRIREEGLHIRQPCAAEAPNMAMSSTLSKFVQRIFVSKNLKAIFGMILTCSNYTNNPTYVVIFSMYGEVNCEESVTMFHFGLSASAQAWH